MLRNTLLIALGVGVAAVQIPRAHASVMVDANASIDDAGNSPLQFGGNAPTAITLVSGASSVQFTDVTADRVTMDGTNFNDPDGVGAAPATSTNTGTSTISGITAPNAGYLVGVFVDGTVPSGTAPALLNFTSNGLGTSFASLSPLLDQVFFIGDGLTGDGTGSVQTFDAPDGATTLYLGIADACFFNGPPGCYDDNSGVFTLDVSQQTSQQVTPAPEPASMALLGTSLAGLGWLRRRKRG